MLLLRKDSSRATHYEVLSVREDSSYDEIRASYRSAILDSHPDKLNLRNLDAGCEERFLVVHKAWMVLCDSKSRAEYDEELRAYRQELEVAADEVKLEEMVVESNGEYFYQCRCGDYFSITSLELQEMGVFLHGNGSTDLKQASILLPCGSCSLKIRLALDVDLHLR